MTAYKVQTSIEEDGSLSILSLPFPAGTAVEVIVLETLPSVPPTNPYPLHNTPYRYDSPFDAVAEEDWEVLS